MAGEIQLNGTNFASESSGTITVNNGTLGSSVLFPTDHIIQISQTQFNTQSSRASTTFGDLSTDITATISNCKSTSKILCWVNLSVGASVDCHVYFRLINDFGSTTMGTEGSDGLFGVHATSVTHRIASFWFIEGSPTFSSNAFRLRVHASNHTGTMYINRRGSDTSFGRLSSNIILMEIAG